MEGKLARTFLRSSAPTHASSPPPSPQCLHFHFLPRREVLLVRWRTTFVVHLPEEQILRVRNSTRQFPMLPVVLGAGDAIAMQANQILALDGRQLVPCLLKEPNQKIILRPFDCCMRFRFVTAIVLSRLMQISNLLECAADSDKLFHGRWRCLALRRNAIVGITTIDAIGTMLRCAAGHGIRMMLECQPEKRCSHRLEGRLGRQSKHAEWVGLPSFASSGGKGTVLLRVPRIPTLSNVASASLPA
mmetsp:Transcript_12034/g.34808  ORF Transcript_12034/g.34808 Transcript_12034/m.34808 type:complete len:245 (-) Transcript_12034:159-893(-)